MPQQYSIIFLLFPKAHLMDLAGPLQVFYEARNLCQAPLEVHFTSFESHVHSEQGLMLGGFKPLSSLNPGKNSLICISGVDFRSFREGELDAAIQRATPWVRQAFERGASLCSICSGALILGRMGLLGHRRYTCHWKCMDYLEQRYPKAFLQKEKIYTEDRRLYTSAGMSTGVDLALYLLEKWFGAFVAARVAQELVVSFRREATNSQRSIYSNFQRPFHPAVYKVQETLYNDPEANPSIRQLAEAVHLSPRHLTRLFRKYTGKTVQEFKQEIRLELARQLLKNGRLGIDEVARRCGYSSARQFRRAWKEEYGVAPSQGRPTLP
ncbi:MAG: helix-turn-helix domain-containing protein [Lewinellaceae bacterium]|nr:helix-turn-helix domain-containing protein [Lewinellaceae bacterium]MCB9289027.1 helix-turn-helix domain-containing protein [Lewinellaceae bacterium]